MKLQKQLSRKVGKIIYPKYIVVIPPKIVEEVGWKEGIELSAEIGTNKVILKSKKS